MGAREWNWTEGMLRCHIYEFASKGCKEVAAGNCTVSVKAARSYCYILSLSCLEVFHVTHISFPGCSY